jgi:hypothetical protein
MITRIIFLIIFAVTFSLAGCSNEGKTFTGAEFDVIWGVYAEKLFMESFDEKKSTEQKEKILRETMKSIGVDYNTFVKTMKDRYPDHYGYVFAKKE